MSETTKNADQSEAPVRSDENMWAMFCHLGGLIGWLLPPGNVIIPLLIWLNYRDKYPLVADQGKEAINFQISLTIYAIISGILVLLAVGLLLLLILAFFGLIVPLVAVVRASSGGTYRYPLTIRLVQ